MNIREIADVLEVSEQWIRRTIKKAVSDNNKSVIFGDRSFSFTMIDDEYDFIETSPKVEKLQETDTSKAWLLASDEKQREAILKQRLVRDYNNRPSSEGWKAFLKRVDRKYAKLKLNKTNLFRWNKIVRDCRAKDLVPLEYLLDSRGKGVSNRSYTDEQYKYMENLILENPDIQTVHIEQYMQMHFENTKIPSYATIVRMVSKWKRDPDNLFIYTLANNPSSAVSKHRPAPGRADSEIMHTNALWELDGTPCDVICSDGIRYAISAAIDVYSRRVVWVIEPSSSSVTLGRMLKKAIEKFGIPERVLCDQGKEYKSKHFAYTCDRLNIQQDFTPPFSGYLKPHIERFFGTLTRDLFTRINGFIGHNTADRERLANRQTFSAKKESIKKWNDRFKSGDDFAKNFANKKENLGIDIELPISIEELKMIMEKWTTHYENRKHSSIDMTPMEKWNSCGVPRNTISDPNVLNILVGSSISKKITKKGITIDKIQYFNDIFYDMVGEWMWCLSDDDLGVIYVYDLNMSFVCKAENYAEMGRSRNEHIASLKFDRKQIKAQKRLDDIRANKPERIEKFLDTKNETIVQDETIDIAIEKQNEVINKIKESIDTKKETKDDAEVLVNGRPIFNNLHDRFMWDFEHDTFDESTQKLAQKKPRLYEMAKEEWEERKLA